MDARNCRSAACAASLLALLSGGLLTLELNAATYRTTNFTVDAPSPYLARQIGDAAEQFRRQLAIEWLGHELPAWEEQCPIKAVIRRGAGGETSFFFTGNRVHGWKMYIQGSPQRMLDSVLPHEVTHTIFATHFRRPVPRWADEGACTTVEHPDEIARIEGKLIEFLKTRRGIRFSDMMWMKKYPQDYMPLYAQGHSLAAYLIGLSGKHKFIRFLEDGMRDENWPQAIQEHYRFANLTELQDGWLEWVRAGRPALNSPNSPSILVASASAESRPLGGGHQKLARTSDASRSQVASGSERATTLEAAPAARVSKLPDRALAISAAQAEATPKGSTVIFEWRKPRLPRPHASAAAVKPLASTATRRF